MADHQDEHPHWHSIFALIFVALPAISGLVFEDGGAVMTDILLLGLGCLFLYWSVKWPWQWYHAAQTKLYLDYDDSAVLDEESEGEVDGQEKSSEVSKDNVSEQAPPASQSPKTKAFYKRQLEAGKSLNSDELTALFTCFVSPPIVAYLLHLLRPYLSRPSGGVVSNSNLTLFVMAAEVRPLLHIFKLIEARTLTLQKIVSEPPPSVEVPATTGKTFDPRFDELWHRISAIETKEQQSPLKNSESKENLPQSPTTKRPDEAMNSSIKHLQTQVDALNRAVRRYEKRSTAQTIILEGRLHDLDNRVSDALSLAAAASRNSNRPGIVSYIISSIYSFVASFLRAVLSLFLVPVHFVQGAYLYLLGPRRKKMKKTNGR